MELDMKYVKEEEKLKLLEKLQRGKIFETIMPAINLLFDSIDLLFKTCKAPLLEARYFGIILELIIKEDEEGMMDFINKVETRADILQGAEILEGKTPQTMQKVLKI